jgi:LPPG:FO 2-phospho-L-lactate transferase
MTTRVTVLAGGVGAARFLRGVVAVVPASEVVAVVNTGDDTDLHGLRICPDLDTCTYTLAGAIDPERGWGLAGETWAALDALGRYVAVRPAGSTAAPTWFGLGDRDLATHLYRTARLAEGARLTEVTAEITRAWGLDLTVLPMSDDPVRTTVTVPGHGVLAFQDYFVRLRHDVAVERVDVETAGATATAESMEAIGAADVVVVAPSNPIVSIGPIRSLPRIDDALAARRDSVVAISPIIGGAALKGPADRMLRDLGHESSVVGVARLYRHVAGTLVVDEVDAAHAAAVEAEGIRCVVAPTVMSDPAVTAALATTVLAAGR